MNKLMKSIDEMREGVMALLRLGIDDLRKEVVADKLKECCEWLEAYYNGVVAFRESQEVR